MTETEQPRYLIWSPMFGKWRGPSILGPRVDRIQEAGRYLLEEAREAVNDLLHSPEGQRERPDEILQLAPEHGGDLANRDSRFAIQEGASA